VFLLCCCSIYASSIDQTGKQKITVIGTDVTLETVFRQIEKQTGLRFMYAVDAVDVKEKVTVMFEKVMLDDVLESLLGKKGIEWVYRERVISLRKEVRAMVEIDTAAAKLEPQLKRIAGRVFDSKGAAIPGASILVKGTTKGTTADNNGQFVLQDVGKNAVLIISSIGFKSIEAIAKDEKMTLYLEQVVSTIDEAVIIGYGITTKRFNTGDVSSVKAEDIEKQPVRDPLLALQGRIPGMTITQTTGVPGGQVKINIRGLNSLNSGTQPLFIIDGIPFDPSVYPANPAAATNTFGAAGAILSAFSFINPNDIESIDVLKDADATAIYGSRGANGVVLITMKKGRVSNTSVNLNYYSGMGNVARKRKLLNTPQYLEMRREAFLNDNAVPSLRTAPDLLLWDTTRYTDWQEDLIGRTSHYNDAQASVSGGSPGVQYIVSGNYHRETMVFPGDFSNQKGGGYFSLTGKSSNEKFSTTLTGNYNIDKTNIPRTDLAEFVTLPPNAPPAYNPDGSLNWAPNPNTGADTWINPYVFMVSTPFDSHTSNLIGKVTSTYQVLPELLVSVSFGASKLLVNTFSGSTIAGVNPKLRSSATASAEFTNSGTQSWIFEPQINYNKKIGNNVFEAMVGGTFLGNRNETHYLGIANIKDDALIKNQAAGDPYIAYSSENKYKYCAIFSRFGYNYKAKYLLNITLRRDGSSRFGPRRQFANFGAIGAGWIFSEEPFIKMPFLSYGKLRASYGVTGNDQIGNYQYLDRYQFTDLAYQGQKGLRVVSVYNPDFAWEQTKKAELGLELGLYKDRVFLTNSYYRNRSSKQLTSYLLPTIIGAYSLTGNQPATIQNSGWEMVLTTKNIQHRNFDWSTSLNLSVSRNKLVSFTGNGSIYAREGKSISEMLLYKIAGVDPNTGSYMFVGDKNEIVPSDQASTIFPLDLVPSYFGGIQNSFRYKGLSLDVFLQFSRQKGIKGLYQETLLPGSRVNQPIEVLNRWRAPGDITDVPRFGRSAASEIYNAYEMMLNSNWGYSDASFIRVKNVSLSWQIPQHWKALLKLTDCRIYFQGQNLFTITKYKGWDPETQSPTSIPPLRVLTFGAQMKF
jgi:TonB-linked SusC/RagA family outer membrane protein